MSVMMMRLGRPPFASGDLRRGTDAEVRVAFDGFISYFGTYTIDSAKHTITHHLQGASYPNWVGGDQVRQYKLDGTTWRLEFTCGPSSAPRDRSPWVTSTALPLRLCTTTRGSRPTSASRACST
jgi:hypothetical protein